MSETKKRPRGRPKQEVKMTQIHTIRLSRNLETALNGYCISHKTNFGQAIRKAVREMIAKDLQEEEKE